MGAADVLREILSSRSALAVAGVSLPLIGILFLWSGIAKLRDPEAASTAIVHFGVMKSDPGPSWGFLLGAVEAALGIALLLRLGGVATPILGFGLLALFTVLIARSLLRGARFTCACFGSASEVISRITLVRTCVLTAGALLAIAYSISAQREIVSGARLVGLQTVGAIGLVASATIAYRLSQVRQGTSALKRRFDRPMTPGEQTEGIRR